MSEIFLRPKFLGFISCSGRASGGEALLLCEFSYNIADVYNILMYIWSPHPPNTLKNALWHPVFGQIGKLVHFTTATLFACN